MPVNPTYPGVYIEELPSGVRTIVGVATSITAFLGRTTVGPVNEPVIINNFGDYERIFGGLSLESTVSFASATSTPTAAPRPWWSGWPTAPPAPPST